MLKFVSIFYVLIFTSISFSAPDVIKLQRQKNCGPNGCNTISHSHTGNVCLVECEGPGNSSCPECNLSILTTGPTNDLSLHNYAKQQIIQGNLTGNQLSSDGLWKVKWEKKQNNDVSIVAWDLAGNEPPLWP